MTTTELGFPMGQERPLVDLFAAASLDLQSRLFRVLDVVVGMSQDEKETVGLQLYAIRQVPDIEPETEALINALESLVFIAERLSRPSFP